jgi:hypothetical protein
LLKHIPKILMVVLVSALVAILAGSAVLADTTATTTTPSGPPSYPVLADSAFLMKANLRLVDLEGAATTTNYNYVDLLITSDTAGAVVGTLNLYPTGTVKDAKIDAGTAHFSAPAVSTSFTMHVTHAGTIKFVCPKGIAGTATSGTATVGSSPLTLAEGTTTTATITGTGTITVALHLVARTITINATGFVGTGYTPHVALKLADGDGYFEGNFNGAFSLKRDNSVKALSGHIDGLLDTNGATSGGQTIFDNICSGLYRSTGG